jgi:hypothetical protein
MNGSVSPPRYQVDAIRGEELIAFNEHAQRAM